MSVAIVIKTFGCMEENHIRRIKDDSKIYPKPGP
jgi:hypothetical protein